jgi:hypothetical protein
VCEGGGGGGAAGIVSTVWSVECARKVLQVYYYTAYTLLTTHPILTTRTVLTVLTVLNVLTSHPITHYAAAGGMLVVPGQDVGTAITTDMPAGGGDEEEGRDVSIGRC